MITFKYLPEKAQQALIYVASQLPEQRNMYKVLKVLYFADIKHLHDFGRFIYGDTYVALQHGPVPSHAYNLVQNTRVRHSILDEDQINSSLFTIKNNDTIVALVQADVSCFSKSDLICLNQAIEECRPLSFSQLKNKSHDQAYNEAGENDNISIESIAHMSADKDALLEHLTNCHD